MLDIINNNRIYLPTYKQLNDPLEGAGFNINISGWAGMSILLAGEMELEPIERNKMKFRVLSLSEEYNSPQLWAHYANNYQGICLCFSTENTFKGIRKVEYGMDKSAIKADSEEEIEKAVCTGFCYKQEGWSYEKEWRLIKRIEDDNEDNKYLSFSREELKGIILGEKMDMQLQTLIRKEIPKEIQVMRARPGYTTHRIIILPWDYTEEFNGEPHPVIEDMEKHLLNGTD